MNFLEAVQLSNTTGKYMRRKDWVDGVALFIAKPSGPRCDKFNHTRESGGSDYVATCHVAACELGGVRCVDDILADDWELMYP